MSYEELEERGIFLPEEEWGKTALTSSANPWLLALLGLALGAACAAMVFGRGGAWTWVGAGAFTAFLWLYTWVTTVGIERQAERVAELRREAEQLRSGGEAGDDSPEGSAKGENA